MKKIIAILDYVAGHLRYGSIIAKLSDEEYEEFKTLSKKEQKDWLMDIGNLTVDYEINDIGSIKDMIVKDA